ncbi:toprim domain-containing protein [Peptoniphilus sp. MSJ-1]|uniref:Toprim domain-containing protein n=1 Tax=Peptoniphilus ovalis TaxID=2841503 RepID=A0ABS6FI08_9FIRM|nr:toprim domain-containing protein [Peptoniphilus ovalis]MBU5669611.1 toprim domain-containing protein [Peptoniphilus ovalis]
MTNVKELLEDYGIDRFLEYVGAEKIRKIGDNFRSCCPIHGGDNSSAFSYHNGYFTCFSECDRNYSPIDILMIVFSLSYPEAKKRLEKLFGQEIENEDTSEITYENLENKKFIQDFKKLKESQKQEENTEFCLNDLATYQKITHEYLINEGFSDETRQFFDLRFCDKGIMRDRVVIPIDDKNGKIIGIAGRSIYDFRLLELTGQSKYFFSKGLKKSNTLYNISRADRYSDYLIVVEGYKSIWRLHEWGYDNAVALMGASLGDKQLKLLLKFNLPILISGDNDKAGKNLQREVVGKLSRYTPVEEFPIEKITSKENDSIAEIKKGDFEEWTKKIMGKYPKKILF